MSDKVSLNYKSSDGFIGWLKEQNMSIVVTTYNQNKIYTISQHRNALSIYFSNYMRPMGINYNNSSLHIGVGTGIMSFSNIGSDNDLTDVGGFTDVFLPQVMYYTGDVDTHDIKGNSTDLYFISAMFNSICKPSISHRLEVVWMPPWIKEFTREDCCHLNGLECDTDGKPRWISAACRADIEGAWKKNLGRGLVYDIKEDKYLCEGLYSPHSPRAYKDRVWVLEAGTGRFGYVADGKFHAKLFLPSFIRGLDFHGDYAVIGGSNDRHMSVFAGLPLGKILKSKNMKEKCAVYIIDMHDIDKPRVIHTLEFLGDEQNQSNVLEMYDVAFIPNTPRAAIKDATNKSLFDVNDFKFSL